MSKIERLRDSFTAAHMEMSEVKDRADDLVRSVKVAQVKSESAQELIHTLNDVDSLLQQTETLLEELIIAGDFYLNAIELDHAKTDGTRIEQSIHNLLSSIKELRHGDR